MTGIVCKATRFAARATRLAGDRITIDARERRIRNGDRFRERRAGAAAAAEQTQTRRSSERRRQEQDVTAERTVIVEQLREQLAHEGIRGMHLVDDEQAA